MAHVKQWARWDVTKSDFFEQLLCKVRAVCGVLSGWSGHSIFLE